MATVKQAISWSIDTNADKKNLEKHGEAGFTRRRELAEKKTAGIKDWKERMFMGPQFEAVAMAATDEQLTRLETLSSAGWSKLVCKLAMR
jgi:hypothetical protein